MISPKFYNIILKFNFQELYISPRSSLFIEMIELIQVHTHRTMAVCSVMIGVLFFQVVEWYFVRKIIVKYDEKKLD